MKTETRLLSNDSSGIDKAAQLLKNGELVGIPTETVYGLAANALDPSAVEKIFAAKGRPCDNPLIVHIAKFGDIEKFGLVKEVTAKAKALAKAFWPGPLTMVMYKTDVVPPQVSGGLDTVAIRMPSHPCASAIIEKSGVPIAAPSANISGKPSPTAAEHVMQDMNGKIAAVVDGGECSVGIESTVIAMTQEPPHLLRPGGITVEQIRDVIGEITVDKAVLEKLDDGATAASPGMKYKHYAPSASVVLLRGEGYTDYVNERKGDNVLALCWDSDIESLKTAYISLGGKSDYEKQAQELFSSLRQIDHMPHITTVYARCPQINGVGAAVYNRLVRAAGFEVIDIEKL